MRTILVVVVVVALGVLAWLIYQNRHVPPLVVSGFSRFVDTRGGAYCFLPSLLALPKLAEIQRPNNVHFTPAGYKVLAEQVVKSLEQAMR